LIFDMRSVVAVVRERVVRLGDADLRIRARALLLADHERDDAREIRLEREHLQVVHQREMVLEHGRDTLWLVHRRQFEILLFLRPLHATFDVAHRLGVLIEPSLIAGTEIAAQAGELLVHRVQDAAVLVQPRLARAALGAPAVSEELFEHRPRVVFHRQRLRRALPRDGVRIGTAQDAGAGAGVRRHVHGELERGNLRLLRELPGQQLVDRDIRDDLDLVASSTRGAGQERARRSGVDVVPVRLQPRDDEHPLPVGLQRFENRRQFEGAPVTLRRPVLHRHAVRDVEGLEAVRRAAGGDGAPRERGHHRVEKRQRERGANPSEDRAARERFR
jgi:hypothetical protein